METQSCIDWKGDSKNFSWSQSLDANDTEPSECDRSRGITYFLFR